MENSTELVTKGLFNNNNFSIWVIFLLGVIVIILTVVLVLILLGKITINKKDEFTTNDESEDNQKLRNVFRKQISFSRNKIQNISTSFLAEQKDEFIRWKIKYVSEKLSDNVVTWISLNHISKDDNHYIEDKQNEVLNIIKNIINTPLVSTKEFEEKIKEETRSLIRSLVEIKEQEFPPK